ncbi:DUF2971 domain-containing protein [Aestuariibacter sp. GS-14]|uniref:DUF2971 domain-containing protein n=1 Tax=Aestuariibacter sp. GS-14 TaxID=2590670 RepID=UPI001128A233|nr:DUF2971 domain-containing protein [Aestuariibacter sp. GS-14]TPV60944.1 DUF2971 domain-containing protein [Aestuariibacter sp. GS-14]
MILYHFVNLEYGLENISKRRLKVSRIKKLNDPFEFQAFDLSNKELRNNVKRGIEAIDKEFGLICFSRSWRSPLQWAHYADRHTGICLGLEILPQHVSLIREVNYVPKRIRLTSHQVTEEDIWTIMATKFEKWDYEEESRIFVPLEESEVSGLFFTPFKSNMRLKEIYIGASCEVSKDDLRKALGDLKEEVKVLKTRAGFTNFNMVVDNRYSPFKL